MRAAIPLCALLLFASCNSSQETTYAEADSPLASASDSVLSEDSAPSDSSTVGQTDVVTGPPADADNRNREVGLTVGERLKKLDLLMQTAPPDSLGILMAEYERLLDSAMGGPAAAGPDGYSSTPVPEAAENDVPTSPRSTPRSSVADNGDNRTLVESDNDARRERAFDPAQYGGARESELEYYRENAPAHTQTSAPVDRPATSSDRSHGDAAAPQSSSATGTGSRTAGRGNVSQRAAAKSTKSKGRKESGSRKGEKGKKNRNASAPSSVAATPSAPSPEPKAAKSSSLNENYTEGLAHFRAGRYRQALTNLKPVANSSGSYRTTAQYYYALSLERTGSLAQAASQFRSLSRGSGVIADKGWLGYCRVLSAQGKKSEAKKELLRLIKQRPGSSQIASAKQMLQKL